MKYHKGEWKANFRDTYDAGSVLSPIITAWLRKFIEVSKDPESCTGIPSSLIEGWDGINFEEGYAKWIETLEKIIYAFENDRDFPIPDGLYDRGIILEDNNAIPDTSLWHSKPELLDGYKKATKEHHIKREEGLRLFAQHYDNLWW